MQSLKKKVRKKFNYWSEKKTTKAFLVHLNAIACLKIIVFPGISFRLNHLTVLAIFQMSFPAIR